MYINEFVAGVASTLLVELAAFFIMAVIYSHKKKK